MAEHSSIIREAFKALYALRWEIRNRERRLLEMEQWCEGERARLAERQEEERVLTRRLLVLDPETLSKVPRYRP